MAQANYYGVINEAECIGCGACERRCHVKAVSVVDGLAIVDREKCIGCGLCVTGCPTGAAGLVPKPEDEKIDPPLNFKAWEDERLKDRGLA